MKVQKLFFNRIYKTSLIGLIFLLWSQSGIAQVKTPPGWYHEPIPHKKIRIWLSKINVETTIGYGNTFYATKPTGLAVYSGANGVKLFNPVDYNSGTGAINSGYSNWFNDVIPEASWNATGTDFVVFTDTTKLKLKSSAINVPLNLALFVKIRQIKVGAGLSFEPQLIRDFHPTRFENSINTFPPDPRLVFMKKYYGLIGGNFYRYKDFIFSGDARIGWWRPGKKFNQGIMDRSLSYNIGAGIEWELSEYFRPYVRGSFEFKNYSMQLPAAPGSIKHRANQANLSVGLQFRLSELPKCFIKNCQIQMNHQHGDREYRSRMHPMWKKQNPNYGENYPTLLKYKRKNKKKLNPY